MIKLRKIIKKELNPKKSFSKKNLFYSYHFPCYVVSILFLFNAFGDVICHIEKGYIYIREGFFKRGISFNKPSVFFIFFCTRITFSVQIFRIYYLPQCEILSFSIIIYSFIVLIILLTRGLNFLSVFLGWEGVGVLSFILIGWFSSREEATKRAKKAILFNRATDFFFFILVLFEIIDICYFFSISDSFDFFKLDSVFGLIVIIVSVSFILCRAGKSAQFIFHPWLTAAMEGPTPVSSLLHRRTIVVAGVWLYSLLFPFLQRGGWELRILIITLTSSVTLIRSSYWAFSQFDLKKIIALSTTSQLRFIILIISVGYIELAYLHMLFHGYFKAMLFIGRGVRIHSNNTSSQDLRGLSNSNSNPYLIVFFSLGNLGLIGIPFFGGFWRKHLILMFVSNPYYSLLIAFSVFIIYFSRIITIGYSIKALMLMGKNPTLMSPSNYKYNLENYKLGTEIIPTLFLSMFVIFFPSSYLLYSNIEENYLTLPFSKWDFFIIFLGGWILVSLIIKPSSFSFVFSWRRNQVLKLSSLTKNLIKFMKGGFLERIILKKKVKRVLLISFSNKEDQFRYNYLKYSIVFLNKRINSFFFSISFFFFLFSCHKKIKKVKKKKSRLLILILVRDVFYQSFL